MPLTPIEALLVALTSCSLNLIDIPLRVTIIICSSSSASLAFTSSSPSRSSTAINPPFRILLYSLSSVFLIIPLLVPIIRYLLSSKPLMGITVATFSSGCSCNRFTIAIPLAVLPASGISYPFNEYTRPILVINKILLCEDVISRCSTKSSSLVLSPAIPLPPLLCALYVSAGVLFTYPICVRVIATSCSLIRSSMSISPS